MSAEQPLQLDERTRHAITELQHTISERYPAAQFEISRAADDPRIVHLITTVDIDDPDEVGDLVIDRVAELVAEERIPVHVIPIRPADRVRAEMQSPAGPAARPSHDPAVGTTSLTVAPGPELGVALQSSTPDSRPETPDWGVSP